MEVMKGQCPGGARDLSEGSTLCMIHLGVLSVGKRLLVRRTWVHMEVMNASMSG